MPPQASLAGIASLGTAVPAPGGSHPVAAGVVCLSLSGPRPLALYPVLPWWGQTTLSRGGGERRGMAVTLCTIAIATTSTVKSQIGCDIMS